MNGMIEMVNKAEIEYWITKMPTHHLHDLIKTIEYEIYSRPTND